MPSLTATAEHDQVNGPLARDEGCFIDAAVVDDDDLGRRSRLRTEIGENGLE